MARLHPVPQTPEVSPEYIEPRNAIARYVGEVDADVAVAEPDQPLILAARTAVARFGELSPPAKAAAGVAAGALAVSGAKLVRRARAARSLKRRAHGPLIAIVSERIQVDLRPRRR